MSAGIIVMFRSSIFGEEEEEQEEEEEEQEDKIH
jgi:hypothetical protein